MNESRQIIPNVFWLSLPWSALQSSPRFVALPAPEQVALHGESTHKYVRQGSTLWHCFHAGTLTTRYINASLGFLEPLAANRLGISRNVAGHSALVEAHRHLVEAAAWDGNSQGGCSYDACQYNEDLAGRLHGGSHGRANHTAAPGQDIGGAVFLERLRDKLESTAAARAPPCVEQRRQEKPRRRAKGSKPKPSAGHSGVLHKEIRRLLDPRQAQSVGGVKRCLYAASGGLQGVRLAWGDLHEPTALFCLMSHMPESWLCEVGLFYVDSLPETPEISLQDLPSLGASPDCIIVHNVACPMEMRHRQFPQQCTDLSREEVELLLASVHSKSGAELHRDGYSKLCDLTDEGQAMLKAALGSGVPFRKTVKTSGQDGGGWVQLAEVVEVKSICPFATRPSGRSSKWVNGSHGPKDGIPTQYIAQLQLEMLATGTMSALLVCQSAQQGVNVHRIFRDEEFIRCLIGTLREFKSDFLPSTDGMCQRPPLNMYWESASFQSLLRRTKHIARTSLGRSSGDQLPSPTWDELSRAFPIQTHQQNLELQDGQMQPGAGVGGFAQFPFVEVDNRARVVLRGMHSTDI